MTRLVFVLSGIVFLWISISFSQEKEILEDFLENFQDGDLNQTDFLEILKDLEDHPIDVNSASVKELLQIPFLNQHIARQIVRYRNRNGNYSGAADLLTLPEITEELLAALSPYIRFQTPRQLPSFDYRFQTAHPLHSIRGFEENRYGNPVYLYQRLRLRPTPDLRIGIIWEKDAGEAKLFDFGSFHLSYYWRKAKSHFHLGDFNLEVGQRLMFSPTYGSPLVVASTLPFTVTPFRWHPKSAVDENAFLRGALWNYSPFATANITIAYSNHNLDANLADDSLSVRSLFNSGYHRTESEESKRNLVNEKAFSGILSNSFSFGHIGLQAARLTYSLPIRIEEEVLRKDFSYISSFYSAQKGLVKLQGEAAFLDAKFPAIQQTFLLRTTQPLITYGALFYYYHPNYWAFHGRAFGKTNSQPSNELGYFLSVAVRAFPKTEIAAYFHNARPVRVIDEFSFLRRTQQIQLTQKIAKSQLLLRFTNRVREGPPLNPTAKLAITELTTRLLRFHINTAISKNLRLGTRVELSWADSTVQAEKNHGVAFYLDARYRPTKNLTVQARWTQFDIPDFDYRIFEFENDLPGSFRNILLNNRGYKWFFLIQYQLIKNWRFALKYREIFYPDEETIGSGLDTVLGNRRQELRFQLQVMY